MDISWWLIVIGVALLIPTAYAGLIGAPYAPTRLAIVRKTFDLIGVDKDDVVVDLGVGDGKILAEATRRQARAYGYELSPILFVVAWIRSLFHRNLRVLYGNFYKQEFPDATVLFAFLMPDNMHKIEKLINEKSFPHLKFLLAYAFPLKNISPASVVRAKNCAPIYVYEAENLKQSP